ncbi:hypothetical protein D3C75_1366910 [compost metagenome]
MAASEQMLLHVDLAGPRSSPFAPEVVECLQGIVDEQIDLPAAEFVGRVMGLPG